MLIVIPAVIATLALAGGALHPAPAESRGGERHGKPAPMPRHPIGAGEAEVRADRGLRLGRRFLVAGSPGQRLWIRYRDRSAAGRRVRVVLRSTSGDGRLASARSRIGRARALMGTRLEGLDPAPGPHRVVVRERGGPVLARAEIEVLWQSRSAIYATRGDGRRAAGAGARARHADARPQPRSLPGGEVNHDLSFRRGSEAASAIAVAGEDAKRVLAATNRAGSAPRIFLSGNGLAPGHVTETALPGRLVLPGGSSAEVGVCCDPSVAADAAGGFWVAATSAGSQPRIVVNRIAAGGTAFRPTSVGLPVTPGSLAGEKPAIAVAEDGSRVGVVWVETAEATQRVVYSGCDASGDPDGCDDPDAWSEPTPISPPAGAAAMPDLAFAPNADGYAVWWDYSDAPGVGNAVLIDRCRDGEDCADPDAWDERSRLADLDGEEGPLPLFCPIIAAPGGLLGPSPSVTVGPLGHVAVAYSDLRDNADPVSPTRCQGSGSDKTFDSFLATDPDPDRIPAPSSAVRISAGMDEAEDLNDHFLPAIGIDPDPAAPGPLVEIAFTSTIDDPGGQHTQRLYRVYDVLTGELTEPSRISTATSRFAGPLSDGFDYGDRQGADSAGGIFRPAWTDNRALQSRDADLYVLSPTVAVEITSGPAQGEVQPIATASLEFRTPAPRLECSLEPGGFAACLSPFQAGPQPNGEQRFHVRATDRAGNVVGAEAVRAWTVQDLDPPETLLVTRPPRRTRAKRPVFAFEADEAEARLECRYDRKRWDRCRSPMGKKVTVGRHRFGVRAIDVGGNVDPTPAEAAFRRLKRKR